MRVYAERWDLYITNDTSGKTRHVCNYGYGTTTSQEHGLVKGKSYTFKIAWTDTNLSAPDYDWQLLINDSTATGIRQGLYGTGIFIVEDDGLLTQLYNGDDVNMAKGKTGRIIVPKIAARKQGTEAAPEDGLIVKEEEFLEIAVAPYYLGRASVMQDKITWEYNCLRVNGTFEGWTALGEGTRVRFAFETPRIMQVRATVNISGTPTVLHYERNRDDPHRFNSDGNPNNLLLTGQPDYVAVASETGYAIVQAARQHLGSTRWARNDAVVTIDTGFTAGDGVNKCNIFVYEVVSPIKAIPTDPSVGFPPRAYEWQDNTYAIAGWTLYSGATRAEPGAVIARPSPNNQWWNPVSYFRQYGHCGITDYDGEWINAGRAHVNRNPHITESEWQPAGFRK